MLNTFLQIIFQLEKITESKPRRQRTLVSKIILNGLKFIVRNIIYYYLRLSYYLNFIKITPLRDNENAPIISLTTYPARIDNLWMVLYLLYRQTIRPSKIIVVFTKEEIPNGEESLPQSLNLFKNRGVEFHFVEENLYPHNKYFYARQWYSSRCVITVDDDLLYYPDTIKRLMDMHKKYPDAVCSNRIHVLKYDHTSFMPYKDWPSVYNVTKPSSDFCALGYSGVLYPPSFKYHDLYNVTMIKGLCLRADDLWLKAMEILANVEVVVGDYYAHPVTLPFSQKKNLQSKNNDITTPLNDIYWENLNKRFELLDIIRKHDISPSIQ